ncbi:MAG: branched-chain amino acid transport system substrate-binding protein [Micromonosporaceae bacterium]|nr:branched-chain amino acid transport system substrate-binding protein [Micromonosporaceae bacterium]
MTDNIPRPSGEINRRDVLRALGVGAAALGTGGLLTGCGKGLKGSGGSGSTDTLKIGYVSPQTGPLASFALADNFIVKQVNDVLRKGITAGGKNRKIEIVVKDTQSSSTRAADMARELILTDKVDLIVGSSTPDTTNPVADQCEANGIPNVTTIAPWEAWYHGRGAKEGSAFTYTTLFFFGMAEITSAFIAMWDRIGAPSKNVGALWPNDTDANAFRAGFPPAMTPKGYKAVDAGAYQDGITDFSAEIAKLKSGGADLFTCTPIPPDFQTFWKQAVQQGYKPKLATVAKVMLFPSEAEALGGLSKNIATDAWWSPYHPYKSTFDGTTAQKLADDFTAATGKQWTQALGSIYSLFEIAVQAFRSASDPKDRKDVAHQLQTMKIEGMSGPLDFTTGPVPGVAIQKLVGAQWREGKKFPWDLYLVDNTTYPTVATNGDLQPTN